MSFTLYSQTTKAFQTGELRCVDQLIDHYAWCRLGFPVSEALACKHVHVVRFVADKFKQEQSFTLHVDSGFASACARGHLITAQYLAQTFGLHTRRQILKDALLYACSCGHLEVVEWLLTLLAQQQHQQPLLCGVNFTLLLAKLCAQGRTAAAQDLVRRWPQPASYHNSFFLARRIFSRSNLEIVQWFFRAFDLPERTERCDLFHAFAESLESGNLSVVKWLADTLQITAIEVRYNHHVALRRVCAHSGLEVVKWFVTTFEFSADEIRSSIAFVKACSEQKFATAQWLTETFGVTRADALESNKSALNTICAAGRLDIAQWFTTTFALTAHDICDHSHHTNSALYFACNAGHLDLVQWLVAELGLATQHIRMADALCGAICGCHLQTAQWLTATFDLNADDARASGNHALRVACAHNDLEIAQWLVETFQLTEADVRQVEWWHHLYDHQLQMLQWVVDARGGLTLQEVISDDDTHTIALKSVCRKRQPATACWLVRKYRLTAAQIQQYCSIEHLQLLQHWCPHLFSV